MSMSKKHQRLDKRIWYVTSDKSGEFPPKVRCTCGYHTLMHTNYLDALAKTRDEWQLLEQTEVLKQKSADKLVKLSRHHSSGDHKGRGSKLLTDDRKYIGYLHGVLDQNPSSRCRRMLSEHWELCTIIDVFGRWHFGPLRVNGSVFRDESRYSSNDGHGPHCYVGRGMVSSSVQKITCPTIPGGW